MGAVDCPLFALFVPLFGTLFEVAIEAARLEAGGRPAGRPVGGGEELLEFEVRELRAAAAATVRRLRIVSIP